MRGQTVVEGRTTVDTRSGATPPDLRAALRELEPFAAVAMVSTVAGGLVAAINSASPFAHGSWLAAYLVLVGGVSQFALGAAPLVLPAPRRSVALRRMQLWTWNAGVAVVAAGVLADLDWLVAAGSAIVLVALGCFAAGIGPAAGARGRVLVYRLAIAGLAISVLIGIVLTVA